MLPSPRGSALSGAARLLWDGLVFWQWGDLGIQEMLCGRPCNDGRCGFSCQVLLRRAWWPDARIHRMYGCRDAWMWHEGVAADAEECRQAPWRHV